MKTLTNPTHAAIDAAVAEHVAGWTDIRMEEGENVDIDYRTIFPWAWEGVRGTNRDGERRFVSPYSTSADAVLDLLNGYEWAAMRQSGVFLVSLDKYFSTSKPHGEAFTFPLAACIALLSAHGVTVEFTEEKSPQAKS